jgi:hypothetical protein
MATEVVTNEKQGGGGGRFFGKEANVRCGKKKALLFFRSFIIQKDLL